MAKVAYGFGILSVAAAALVRWVMGEHVLGGLPYITLFPAIILVTFFGGVGPGVLATLLSAAVAWLAFVPPPNPDEWVSLVLYVAMAGVNVAPVGLLNRGLDHLFDQRNSVRTLIESASNPAGPMASC